MVSNNAGVGVTGRRPRLGHNNLTRVTETTPEPPAATRDHPHRQFAFRAFSAARRTREPLAERLFQARSH